MAKAKTKKAVQTEFVTPNQIECKQNETITPERAQELLKRNYPYNRAPIEPTIERLQKEIEAGSFHPNSVIQISEDNWLIDGQHRLLACVRSGKSIVCQVLQNVPTRFIEAIDTGHVRPPGASVCLATLGLVKPSEAGVAKILYALDHGSFVISYVHRRDIASTAAAHMKSLQWLRSVKHRMPAPFLAAIAYAYPAYPDQISAFAEKVANNDNCAKGTPEWRLNKYFTGISSRGDSIRSKQVEETLKEARNYVTGLVRTRDNSPLIEWWTKARSATKGTK